MVCRVGYPSVFSNLLIRIFPTGRSSVFSWFKPEAETIQHGELTF